MIFTINAMDGAGVVRWSGAADDATGALEIAQGMLVQWANDLGTATQEQIEAAQAELVGGSAVLDPSLFGYAWIKWSTIDG